MPIWPERKKMIVVIERLLLAVLSITLSTSCVIALLLALSALLRKRYSARWLYLVWFAVAMRLLIPANIPLPMAHISLPVSERIINLGLADPAATPSSQEETPVGDGDMAAPVQVLFSHRTVSVMQILAVVWVSGVACFLAMQTAGYLRFKRRLRCHRTEYAPEHIRDLLEQAGAEMELTALPEIRINGGVPAPLLMGLFRPALLLPHASYKDTELSFILRHELMHYRRHDLWYKLLLLAAQSVHWFNPLVAVMVRDAGRQMEMSCDDAVMAGLGPSLRADYCEIILNTLPVRGGPAMTTSFSNLKGNTKMRIDNLFDKTRKRKGIASLCSVVLLTAVIGSLVGYTPVAATVDKHQANGNQIPAASDPRLTLVEREFTIAELQSMDISGVEVIVPTENVSITRGGDTLRFSYYQLSDSEYDFTTVHDGGHTRTYWALLRMTEGRSDDPQRTIHVTLPENYMPKTIYARTASGNISVNGCKAEGIGIWISSQSGNIALDKCEANFIKALSNTGDINVQDQLAASNKIASDTGAVLFQPRDSVSNYYFDISTKPTNTITINGQSYTGGEFELNRSASKRIWIESGYVELPDKDEIPGEGTATFTIRD